MVRVCKTTLGVCCCEKTFVFSMSFFASFFASFVAATNTIERITT